MRPGEGGDGRGLVAGGRRRGRRRQLLGLDGEAHPAEAVAVAADEVVGLGLVQLEREAAALAVVVDGVGGVALVVPDLVHLHHVRLPRRVVEHCIRQRRRRRAAGGGRAEEKIRSEKRRGGGAEKEKGNAWAWGGLPSQSSL